ncbi:hypothetical protein M5K25_005364 [Dendrobium thyrsiflorum]|uniref:Uncharacterized protein n=1 Tax=Dendrobium thyrsiflorum TaxID=117978 RepID=A0ABD0VHA6_DENTH
MHRNATPLSSLLYATTQRRSELAVLFYFKGAKDAEPWQPQRFPLEPFLSITLRLWSAFGCLEFFALSYFYVSSASPFRLPLEKIALIVLVIAAGGDRLMSPESFLSSPPWPKEMRERAAGSSSIRF